MATGKELMADEKKVERTVAGHWRIVNGKRQWVKPHVRTVTTAAKRKGV